MMIVVTGATGKLGHLVLERLLDKIPAERIAASTRDPTKASDLAGAGIHVRHGDFAHPDSLASAFEGASQVLIVSSNAAAHGGDALVQHRAAIEAARFVGARRIVYTSHMGVGPTSAFKPMHDHAATEAMLQEAAIPWTALRNGFYAETVPMMIGDGASTGILAAPQDGKVSWTTHEDLAAAAVAILLEEGRFEGPTPPLTAAEALDLDEIASMLSELGGKPITRRVITDEEQASTMAGNGVPLDVIDITLGMYQAARGGEFAAVDPTLATLVGRSPVRLRTILAARA